jgi:regulator of protease activity HflC (stomatin/prohibitin superfamily)
VINAEAEFQAAAKLSEAAAVINSTPSALQLRYLQTLREIGGGEQNSTIVFPLPIDLVKPLLDAASSKAVPANGELPEAARNELPKPQ